MLAVCGVQIGNFYSAGQQYSLMTLNAARASQSDDRRLQRRRMDPTSRRVTISISNSTHVIEPVTHDDIDIAFDSRMYRYTTVWRRKTPAVRHCEQWPTQYVILGYTFYKFNSVLIGHGV